jgi:hypothetical protein
VRLMDAMMRSSRVGEINVALRVRGLPNRDPL